MNIKKKALMSTVLALGLVAPISTTFAEAPDGPGAPGAVTPGTAGPEAPTAPGAPGSGDTAGPEVPTAPGAPGAVAPGTATPGPAGPEAPTAPGAPGAVTPGTAGPATPGPAGPEAPTAPGAPGSEAPGTAGPGDTAGPATPGPEAPTAPGAPGAVTPGTAGPGDTAGPATPGPEAPTAPGAPGSDDTAGPATPGPDDAQPGDTTKPGGPGMTDASEVVENGAFGEIGEDFTFINRFKNPVLAHVTRCYVETMDGKEFNDPEKISSVEWDDNANACVVKGKIWGEYGKVENLRVVVEFADNQENATVKNEFVVHPMERVKLESNFDVKAKTGEKVDAFIKEMETTNHGLECRATDLPEGFELKYVDTDGNPGCRLTGSSDKPIDKDFHYTFVYAWAPGHGNTTFEGADAWADEYTGHIKVASDVTLTAGKASPINAVVGKAINEVVVTYDVEGAEDYDITCKVEGMDWATTKIDKDKKSCLINGTPDKEGNGAYKVVFTLTTPDGEEFTAEAESTFEVKKAEDKVDDKDKLADTGVSVGGISLASVLLLLGSGMTYLRRRSLMGE